MRLITLVAASAVALVAGKALIDLSTKSSADRLRHQVPAAQAERPHLAADALTVDRSTADAPFRCDGRQHCSQMRSCAEARFFLATCPGTKMDGDYDGVPCEDQHCRDR